MKWMRFWLASLIVLLVMLISPACGFFKGAYVLAQLLPDYQIQSYQTFCQIDETGAIHVAETLDLVFSEDLEQIQFKLLQGNSTSVELDSVKIGDIYADPHTASLIEILPAESTGQSGSRTLSYSLSPAKTGLSLTVSAWNPAQSSRRFIISYTLKGTFLKTPDGLALRQPFFQSLGAQTLIEPILIMKFPASIDLTHAWVQAIGAENFLAARVDDQTIQISSTRLAANRRVEAALVIPDTSIPAAFAAHSETQNSQSLINLYQAELDRLTQQQVRRSLTLVALMILILIAAVIYLLLKLLVDYEGHLQLKQTIPAQFASLWRPALLARISRRHHPGQLLLGTLMDMVYKGHLKLDGHVFTRIEQPDNPFRDLAAYEIFLLQWLFGRVTQEKTLSTAQIRKYALDHCLAVEFSAYYTQFLKLIQDELIHAGLIDPTKKQKCRYLGIGLGTGYMLLTVISGVLTHSFLAGILLIPSGLFFEYGLRSGHLSREGYHQANIARVYRQSLKNFARLYPADQHSVKPLSAALPAAVALGVSRSYLDQIQSMLSGDKERLQDFLLQFSNSLIAADPERQIQAFSHDLEAMDSMLSASLYLALGFHA